MNSQQQDDNGYTDSISKTPTNTTFPIYNQDTNDKYQQKTPEVNDNTSLVNNFNQNFQMNNIIQEIQHSYPFSNPLNSAFYPYFSQFQYRTNLYYNYCLYQYYISKYKDYLESLKETDHHILTPSNIDSKKEYHCFDDLQNPMNGIIKSSFNKNALLNIKRERSVKNNKLVYIHNKKTLVEEKPKKKVNQKNTSKSQIYNSHKGKSLNKSRGSIYRGVSRNGNQWQVLIMVNKKKRYIGSFSTEEEASRAYDRVSLQNHGIKAKTNHPYTDVEIANIINSPKINFREM